MNLTQIRHIIREEVERLNENRLQDMAHKLASILFADPAFHGLTPQEILGLSNLALQFLTGADTPKETQIWEDERL